MNMENLEQACQQMILVNKLKSDMQSVDKKVDSIKKMNQGERVSLEEQKSEEDEIRSHSQSNEIDDLDEQNFQEVKVH